MTSTATLAIGVFLRAAFDLALVLGGLALPFVFVGFIG